MKERDEREITKELLEARKPEKGGVKVEAIGSFFLAGDLPNSEKDIPPGAVVMLTQEEYERLSKPQREPVETDMAKLRKKYRVSGQLSDKQIDRLIESEESMIEFLLSQPGGKKKLENLKAKSGPIVKKTKNKLSTKAEIKALQQKRKMAWVAETKAAIEQVSVKRSRPTRYPGY